MSKATLLFDPIGLIVEVFNDQYPGVACSIVWRQGMKEGNDDCYGCTDFSYATPEISIDVELPMAGVIEVLAHELAHVAAGHSAGHGTDWQASFDHLHEEYSRRVEALETENDKALEVSRKAR